MQVLESAYRPTYDEGVILELGFRVAHSFVFDWAMPTEPTVAHALFVPDPFQMGLVLYS